MIVEDGRTVDFAGADARAREPEPPMLWIQKDEDSPDEITVSRQEVEEMNAAMAARRKRKAESADPKVGTVDLLIKRPRHA